MKVIRSITLAELKEHESKQPRLNVYLGSYHMPPAEEFSNRLVTLEDADLERLFLLSDFLKDTVGHIGKLKGATPTGKYAQIVADKLQTDIDLRVNESIAPVIVCRSTEAPLSIIDGNHRLTAHLQKFGSIEGVYAIVCVHARISSWGHLAMAARDGKRLQPITSPGINN